MELTVIIPAYNEEKRIGKTLQHIGSFFKTIEAKTKGRLNRTNIEIIVIVNNTTDNTLAVVKQYSRKFPFISAVNVPFFTGKGGAIALGFELAKGRYVAFADADASSGPKEILKLYNAITKDAEIEGIIASRYVKGGRILGYLPLSRRMFSRAFNMITRLGFGLNYRDTQCGYKIFKGEVAKQFANKISTVGWTFDLNLLLMAKYFNYSIKEVPVSWRFAKGSTLNARKALVSVTKEIITLKKLELRMFWDSFINRTFKSNVELMEKRAMFLTSEDLWERAATRAILQKLAQDYSIHVFMPNVSNKDMYERIGTIEFTRRGTVRSYPYWFAVYYPVFFKRMFSSVYSWNETARAGLSRLLMPYMPITITSGSVSYKGQSYKLTLNTLRQLLAVAGTQETLVSKKMYAWNAAKVG